MCKDARILWQLHAYLYVIHHENQNIWVFLSIPNSYGRCNRHRFWLIIAPACCITTSVTDIMAVAQTIHSE